MTGQEQRVAAEILRIALEQLALAPGPPGPRGPPPAVDPEAPLAAQLDSLALLSLVVAVEDRFRVALTDDDAAAARSLADLARLVAARAPAEQLP